MATVHLRLFSLLHDREQPALLPPGERERAARFLREEDRRRYLLGRTVVRQLCAAFSGQPEPEIPLRETEQGKPYLESTAPTARQLHFNLAHSGDCVALAWSVGSPVGVDVEVAGGNRTRPYQALAKTAFSDAEREALARVPESAVAETFFRIWVRKEAIVKAEGCGIAGALQRFSVATWRHGAVSWPAWVPFPGNHLGWKLLDVPAPEGYAAAVAMTPENALSVEPADAFPPARAAFLPNF